MNKEKKKQKILNEAYKNSLVGKIDYDFKKKIGKVILKNGKEAPIYKAKPINLTFNKVEWIEAYPTRGRLFIGYNNGKKELYLVKGGKAISFGEKPSDETIEDIVYPKSLEFTNLATLVTSWSMMVAGGISALFYGRGDITVGLLFGWYIARKSIGYVLTNSVKKNIDSIKSATRW